MTRQSKIFNSYKSKICFDILFFKILKTLQTSDQSDFQTKTQKGKKTKRQRDKKQKDKKTNKQIDQNTKKEKKHPQKKEKKKKDEYLGRLPTLAV